jgi:hypothetical protein
LPSLRIKDHRQTMFAWTSALANTDTSCASAVAIPEPGRPPEAQPDLPVPERGRPRPQQRSIYRRRWVQSERSSARTLLWPGTATLRCVLRYLFGKPTLADHGDCGWVLSFFTCSGVTTVAGLNRGPAM